MGLKPTFERIGTHVQDFHQLKRKTMTKQEIWVKAYFHALQYLEKLPKEAEVMFEPKGRAIAVGLAAKAVEDFETAFPFWYATELDMPSTETDFIKIPKMDSSGFILPDWVKPGAECIFEGYVRIIDFIGQDERKIWCCRLAFDGDPEKARWAFVSNLKPKNG